MIRVDAVWLAVEPVDLRCGAERLLARVVQVFGQAHSHHGYPSIRPAASTSCCRIAGTPAVIMYRRSLLEEANWLAQPTLAGILVRWQSSSMLSLNATCRRAFSSAASRVSPVPTHKGDPLKKCERTLGRCSCSFASSNSFSSTLNSSERLWCTCPDAEQW